MLLVNTRVFQPLLLLATAAAIYPVVCLAISMLGRGLHLRLIPGFAAARTTE